MTMRQLDLGNNESMSRGYAPVSGGFLAMTYTESKHFKTEPGAIAWLARRGFAADGTRLPDSAPAPAVTLTSAKHGFLDLSTGHLPQQEMQNIAAAPPRVIVHEYGAWVNVDITKEQVDWEDFPVLKGLILLAREDSDIWWINFDRDASAIEELPTFDW